MSLLIQPVLACGGVVGMVVMGIVGTVGMAGRWVGRYLRVLSTN